MKTKKWLIGITTVITLVMFLMAGCGFLFYNSSSDDEDDGGTGSGTGGGSTTANPTITIRNNTGYTLGGWDGGFWMKPPTSTDWGSRLISQHTSISDGQSQTVTLSQPLSAQSVYDIRLRASSGGFLFIKYSVTISNGMTIAFTASDLNDESNLPSITIQNRSGVSFNAVHVKPSSSSDWGTNFGSISNNDNRSVTIPIPPSNHTVFDIQVRSTNPVNTYTKNNVTISNGMVLTYTTADADNPIIGNPIILIQNNTGFTIQRYWIKLPRSTDWGASSRTSLSIPDGQSRTITLPHRLSENAEDNIYDIRINTNNTLFTFTAGQSFIRYSVSIHDGMIVAFTTVNDESDLPSITIQNRSGVNFNSIHIRPRRSLSHDNSSYDWGISFGSISNNADRTVTIPIPLGILPANYTSFDIQARSTDPTNTYTMEAVNEGATVMFRSSHAGNPLIALPVIVIENNTGFSIQRYWIKLSSSTDWGSSSGISFSLSDGQSRTITLPNRLSVNTEDNIYDIRINTNNTLFTFTAGQSFINYSVSMSEGRSVAFTIEELE